MNKLLWFSVYAAFSAAVIAGVVLYSGSSIGSLGVGVGLSIVTLIFILTVGQESALERLALVALSFANNLGLWFLLTTLFPALLPIVAVIIAFGGGSLLLIWLHLWPPKRD